jgi:hypothetical protein
MPLWAVILISILILIFSTVSFTAFIYWMIKSWNDYSIELRLGKVFYLFVLGIINLIGFYTIEGNVPSRINRKESNCSAR